MAPNFGGIQPLPYSPGIVIRREITADSESGDKFITVLAINNGIDHLSERIRKLRPMCEYELGGRWGEVRENLKEGGTVIAMHKPIAHVTWDKVVKVLARMEAQHRKALFQYADVDPQSQAAFDLASKGKLLPWENSPPIHHSLELSKFRRNRPEFAVKTRVLNETGANVHYLRLLVHNIGAELKCGAVCNKIRRVRLGPAVVDDCLLPRYFTLRRVCANVAHCTQLFENVLDNNQDTSNGDKDESFERISSETVTSEQQPLHQILSPEQYALLADRKRKECDINVTDKCDVRQPALLSWESKGKS